MDRNKLKITKYTKLINIKIRKVKLNLEQNKVDKIKLKIIKYIMVNKYR